MYFLLNTTLVIKSGQHNLICSTFVQSNKTYKCRGVIAAKYNKLSQRENLTRCVINMSGNTCGIGWHNTIITMYNCVMNTDEYKTPEVKEIIHDAVKMASDNLL